MKLQTIFTCCPSVTSVGKSKPKITLKSKPKTYFNIILTWCDKTNNKNDRRISSSKVWLPTNIFCMFCRYLKSVSTISMQKSIQSVLLKINKFVYKTLSPQLTIFSILNTIFEYLIFLKLHPSLQTKQSLEMKAAEKKASWDLANKDFIARPDQGHRSTLLEVPGLTCPDRGSNPGLPRGKRIL